MKKNIGATLALYPSPVIVVGAMVDGKPNWTLVAHAGTVAHSHLMVSMVQAHYTNKGIRENKMFSVNVVDESWLKEADRMGVISGNKEDKSDAFKKALCRGMIRFIRSTRLNLFCIQFSSLPALRSKFQQVFHGASQGPSQHPYCHGLGFVQVFPALFIVLDHPDGTPALPGKLRLA